MAIDHIVYNLNSGFDPSDAVPSADLVKLPPTGLIPPTKVGESPISPKNVEKYPLPDFVSSPLTIRPLIRRARRHIADIWKQYWEKPDIPPSATQLTLRRMVRTRRLVTALGRLLGTKSDVVTQIRKRLMRSAQGDTGEALEVAIYMGDVQGQRLRDAESLGSFICLVFPPNFFQQIIFLHFRMLWPITSARLANPTPFISPSFELCSKKRSARRI